MNEKFYLSKPEPLKACLLAMRSVLLNFHPPLTETTKYGMPCFCLVNKAICYLWTDKKTNEPYFLIVDGNQIDHPQLEVGARSRMKILRSKVDEDLDLKAIGEVLSAAIALHEKR